MLKEIWKALAPKPKLVASDKKALEDFQQIKLPQAIARLQDKYNQIPCGSYFEINLDFLKKNE